MISQRKQKELKMKKRRKKKKEKREEIACVIMNCKKPHNNNRAYTPWVWEQRSILGHAYIALLWPDGHGQLITVEVAHGDGHLLPQRGEKACESSFSSRPALGEESELATHAAQGPGNWNRQGKQKIQL